MNSGLNSVPSLPKMNQPAATHNHLFSSHSGKIIYFNKQDYFDHFILVAKIIYLENKTT